jgi:hypothetical protein
MCLEQVVVLALHGTQARKRRPDRVLEGPRASVVLTTEAVGQWWPHVPLGLTVVPGHP